MSTPETTRVAETGSALDELFAGGHLLCDGAMGTMLYGNGEFTDRCCDELNLSQFERVASIHAEYLRAGAAILETNTFGANAFRLDGYRLRDKVRGINLAGVRIARQCIRQNASEACVAGSIGPLGVQFEPSGRVSIQDARAAFAEQIGALTAGGPGVGVDLLMIETMTSLAEAAEAIHAAQETAPGLRVVVMVTVDAGGNCLDGTSAAAAAERLTDLGADMVGCNCSDGPASVLCTIEKMRTATHLPLAAMPNAGLPRLGERGSLYAVSPAEMAVFTHQAIQAGVNLVGGCCGTTPEHTRAMKTALLEVFGLGHS